MYNESKQSRVTFILIRVCKSVLHVFWCLWCVRLQLSQFWELYSYSKEFHAHFRTQTSLKIDTWYLCTQNDVPVVTWKILDALPDNFHFSWTKAVAQQFLLLNSSYVLYEISCNWVDLVVGIGLKTAFVGIGLTPNPL